MPDNPFLRFLAVIAVMAVAMAICMWFFAVDGAHVITPTP
jgi:hypothetical protein